MQHKFTADMDLTAVAGVEIVATWPAAATFCVQVRLKDGHFLQCRGMRKKAQAGKKMDICTY